MCRKFRTKIITYGVRESEPTFAPTLTQTDSPHNANCSGLRNTGISPTANIPSPCALQASLQIFGRGMRTHAFAMQTPCRRHGLAKTKKEHIVPLFAIRTGISPTANIFARASCEQAPVGLLAKCEPMRLLCKRCAEGARESEPTFAPMLTQTDSPHSATHSKSAGI